MSEVKKKTVKKKAVKSEKSEVLEALEKVEAVVNLYKFEQKDEILSVIKKLKG